ncbi:hypothetical protein J132_08207 [Termitomyces sp. J132]|nr:hypothetical protein J132_08207 [Termitomyces sp. J132]
MPDEWTLTTAGRIERPLGDSEFAFFPASKDGLGDMFLHLAFRAPKAQLRARRVAIAWALLRCRHPLLTCQVIEEGEVPRFSFRPPESVQAALEEAKAALYFRHESKEELISGYLNGPRTLSNTQLSCLIISSPILRPYDMDDCSSKEHNYDLLMCAPHFTGDGTSLHQCTHDLLELFASSMSDEDMLASIDLSEPWASTRLKLPPAFESRCTVPRGKFARGVAKVNFLMTKEREIGNHRLTRLQCAPQKTVFLERVFNETHTKAILKRCKENGVTINHAIEALSGVAWARVVNASNKHNVYSMIYTAINVRPHLAPSPDPTYWFLALTYFNLVFPSFPPSSHRAFWLRAKSAKTQTHAVVHSPLLVHRTLEMASERAARARKEPQPVVDVPKLLNTTTGNLLPGPAPSAALLGLSLIGNLDTTYDRRAYPAFSLKDVTTASRQKAGGILLLVHTFGGRLWLQLFYDTEGFGSDGEIEQFWHELGNGVEEFLIA